MRILYIDTVATAESETERRETREDDVDDKQNSNLQCALLYAAAALALLGLEPSRGSLRAVYPSGTRALTAQLIANPTAPVARRALLGILLLVLLLARHFWLWLADVSVFQ
mmetsp:Transcript_27471/g.62156  ORF Transcript_27471/g.62156 Transcript_27471/m.62156 type:complete len:111 (+) Transcript_27471:204-536(+)